MPNAGYPVVTRTQVRYQGKPEYFARELSGLAAEGAVRILGGCCGTTPAHIAALRRWMPCRRGSCRRNRQNFSTGEQNRWKTRTLSCAS